MTTDYGINFSPVLFRWRAELPPSWPRVLETYDMFACRPLRLVMTRYASGLVT